MCNVSTIPLIKLLLCNARGIITKLKHEIYISYTQTNIFVTVFLRIKIKIANTQLQMQFNFVNVKHDEYNMIVKKNLRHQIFAKVVVK